MNLLCLRPILATNLETHVHKSGGIVFYILISEMLDSSSPLYPLYAMQLMIRDNKLPPHNKQKKQYSHTVVIVIVKPNSQANQLNTTTPSKVAAKSTGRTESTKKPKPQPHYTHQADPGTSNRKEQKQRS
jgi:hypothetical protein